MNKSQICSYCLEEIICDNILKCNQCLKLFHIKCLKRPGTPGDMQGDVFFDFTCIRCSPLEEIFIRKKIPWVMIIVLAIYNLTIQSQGLSHNGYFHWRSHISVFIDKNWKYLFTAHTKQRKKWFGTLSGVLSAHSPEFFVSGCNQNLTDSGWWKLSSKNAPKYFMTMFENLRKKQNKIQNKTEDIKEESEFQKYTNISMQDLNEQSESSENDWNEDYTCSRLLPYMGKKRKRQDSEQSINSENSVKLNLINFLSENISSQDSLLESPMISLPSYEDLTFNSNSGNPITWSEDQLDVSKEILKKGEQNFQPRIVQVTNFQNIEEKSNLTDEKIKIKNSEAFSSSESIQSDHFDERTDFECSKSLFIQKPPRPLPWLKRKILSRDKMVNDEQKLSEYEEKKLYIALNKIFNLEKHSKIEQIPTNIRLLYRKLSLRLLKKQNGLKPFDMRNFFDNNLLTEKKNILDRYSYFLKDSLIYSTSGKKSTFLAQLSGSTDYELFESPFTSRVLMPFIYRNSTYFPNWLKLICEIKFSKLEINNTKVERSTIDFCYVRPYHIAGVNNLLEQMFWPGIDMSECLSYPDFTVVALYKKLIIGCAFMVPDVSYNEAYISYMAVRPHWQHSGLASFMLYHLTQTCMGKDITLHVSASNPAVCLYQKFGFKIEEIVLDFYEKYLPIESTQSRHAYFLRLKR